MHRIGAICLCLLTLLVSTATYAAESKQRPWYLRIFQISRMDNTLAELQKQQNNIKHIKTKEPKAKLAPHEEILASPKVRKKLLQMNVEAPAKEKPPTPLKQTQKKQLWNLRNADIRQVITAIANLTNKRFIIDPRVNAKVTLVSKEPLDPKASYEVFLSILDVAGFSAVPSGKVIKIVPHAQARHAGVGLSTVNNPSDSITASVIPLRYVSAELLLPSLRPLLPNWQSITSYKPSNSLIVIGQASQIDRIQHIVNKVDSASENDIDSVPLQYAVASEAVKTIASLQSSAKISGAQTVSVAADDRSNTVLISGTKAARLRTKIMLSEMDTPSKGHIGGNTEVIYLEYMQATDLAPLLAGVARAQFQGDVATTIGTRSISRTKSVGDKTNESNTTDDKKTSDQNKKVSGPRIEIIAEPNNNALIINAPSSVMRSLKSVIARLDIRPAQVLVEAIIAEINENNIQNLGIDWGQLSDASAGAENEGLFRQGFGIINKDFFHDLVGQIRFLANDNNANILSTPSLLVLDNHLAHIKVGNEVSIKRSSQPSNAAGTTTATPFNTFDRESVGLVLNVTPQITKNNAIKLSIAHQNNSPRNIDDSTGTQAFDITEIETSVIVKSGDIVVLGGLTSNEYSNAISKTPYLGDIPGIGHLLKRTVKTRNRKKLMVFLRPMIVNTPQSSVRVANDKYEQLRDAQLAYFAKEPHNNRQKAYILPPKKPLKRLPPPFRPQ